MPLSNIRSAHATSTWCPLPSYSVPQVWSLLPGFCREPTDVPDSFPGLARILGTALTERQELRATIAHSLKQLVQASRKKGGPDC